MVNSSGTEGRKILLIGDINKVFLDVGAVRRVPCEVRTNMLDGVDTAAKNSFAAIAVVMAGLSAKLSLVLTALKESSKGAKIILLAQTYEEPLAIRLSGVVSNGTTLASDYLICPVEAAKFYEDVISAPRREAGRTSVFGGVDATTEAKIKRLEELATTDELTGLKNRRYIWEFSRQIIEYARGENARVTLLVFDIDNFKHYNDVYGHSAGDKILKQAAILMRRCCRRHDVVGRVGGDEFGVVFWDDPQRKAVAEESERRLAMAEHPREAIFIAKRFRRELEKAELNLLGPGGEGVLTISGGLASFPRDGSTIEELFEQADAALLEAKRSGKNRIYLVGKPQSDIADIE